MQPRGDGGCALMRLRWSPHVQIRREHFGAIAYDKCSQRLMLINKQEVVLVAELLRGVDDAARELEPLKLGPVQLERLLVELMREGLVVLVERRRVWSLSMTGGSLDDEHS